MRYDGQKKLEASLNQIKKLTAHPIMTIEQTKAKNNQEMIRKIQKNVDTLNNNRSRKISILEQSKQNMRIDNTLQEDSFFSAQNSKRAGAGDPYYVGNHNQSYD